MSKTNKLLLGAATFWPTIYAVYFLVFVTIQLIGLSSGNGRYPLLDPAPTFLGMVMLHFFTMAVLLALMAVYMTHIMRNKALDKDHKLYWLAGMIFFNMLAMPVYWYWYFWEEPLPAPNTGKNNRPAAPGMMDARPHPRKATGKRKPAPKA